MNKTMLGGTHHLEGSEKLRELVLYLALVSDNDQKFGSTKLNKLLFYSDFRAYLKYGKPISDQEYQRLPKGPAPRIMLPLIEDMETKKELAIASRSYHGKLQKKPVALRQPNLSVFSPQEIALIDEVVRERFLLNASDISEASHTHLGWKLAGNRETIPFGAALLEKRNLTEQEKQWAHEMDMTGIADLLSA